MATQIVKKKEKGTGPHAETTGQLENVEEIKRYDVKQFTDMIGDIKNLGTQADKMLMYSSKRKKTGSRAVS